MVGWSVGLLEAQVEVGILAVGGCVFWRPVSGPVVRQQRCLPCSSSTTTPKGTEETRRTVMYSYVAGRSGAKALLMVEQCLSRMLERKDPLPW